MLQHVPAEFAGVQKFSLVYNNSAFITLPKLRHKTNSSGQTTKLSLLGSFAAGIYKETKTEKVDLVSCNSMQFKCQLRKNVITLQMSVKCKQLRQGRNK